MQNDEPPAQKRIAFSFDDGPMPDGPLFAGEERTQRLIAELDKANVEQAVFYMTTKNITGETEDGRVKAYAKAGHLIANHSHSHQWLHQIGAGPYIADIDRAEERLAGYDNRRSWFRFPYLDEGRDVETRDAVRAALNERGLMNGYVTVDTFDWHMVDLARAAVADGKCVDFNAAREIYVGMFVDAAEHYDAMAREAMRRAPAQVILLHENDFAALFAGDLARGLREAGWEIITADEAYEDDLAGLELETLFAGAGRVAAIAYEAGFRADRLDHPASEEAPIDAHFEEAHVFGACGGE